jgi:hypothetical protein
MPESPMGLTVKSDEKLSSIVPYGLQISLFYAAYLSSHTLLKNISITYKHVAYLFFILVTDLKHADDIYRLASADQQV